MTVAGLLLVLLAIAVASVLPDVVRGFCRQAQLRWAQERAERDWQLYQIAVQDIERRRARFITRRKPSPASPSTLDELIGTTTTTGDE